MATAEKSFNDVMALFSNGGLQSTNYGLLVTGSFSDHIPPDGKNRINNRGSIIADCQIDKSYQFNIEFSNNKMIIININVVSNGLTVSTSFTQNGEEYTYEGERYTGGSGGINIDGIDGQQRLAWMLNSGYSVSLCRRDQENRNTSDWGIMMIPNAYDDGTLYRKDVPVEVISEREISYAISIWASDNGINPDTPTIPNTVAWHFFEDISLDELEYDEGDITPSGGGGGSYQSRNDAMTWPDLPSLSAVSSGLVSLYAPTAAQMLQISSWLWSDNFYDNIIKNFSSPFDNIVGLYISPVIPASAAATFIVGNVDSDIPVNKVSNPYVVRDCGSISVRKFYNSFADYDNYRSFKLFLPYYGIVDLSTDDFIGGSLAVRYNVDCFSGTATINVMTQRANSVPHILHQYTTNLFSAIPYSGVNMMNYFNQIGSASASLITQGMSGNPIGMTAGISGLISAHPTYGGSKGISMAGGLMGIQYPYLIECRSIRDMPPSYNKYNGIPSNKYKQVSTLSGYTEFDSIRVSAANATDSELSEIEKILKEGVIL